MEPIKSLYRSYEISRKYIRKDRVYVQIENKYGKTETMPFANYQWLICNPPFPGIPKGYVVHHLDHDEFNDDPSNLALMGKDQHTAHHWKTKTVNIPLEFDVETDNNSIETYGTPVQKPTISEIKGRGRWRINYTVKTPDGSKGKSIYNYNGTNFKSFEAAKAAFDEIWPVVL